MKPSILLIAALCAGPVAFAQETAADTETAAPAPKYEKPSYGLSIKAYPPIAKKSGNKNPTGGMAIRNLTKTTTYQMKWNCSVRVRGTRPSELKLEVFYIGTDADNQYIQIGETERPTIELNDKGVWAQDLLSPETTFSESKRQKNRNADANEPEKTGERIRGCVIRLIAEDKVVKTWVSDSRWDKASKKETFAVEDLIVNRSKIGVK